MDNVGCIVVCHLCTKHKVENNIVRYCFYVFFYSNFLCTLNSSVKCLLTFENEEEKKLGYLGLLGLCDLWSTLYA